MKRSRWAGFTLIELLIVVAIIAILAGVAVPNFLEAHVRAKAARTRSDLRALAIALEAYHTDFNAYPPNSQGPVNGPTPGSILTWGYPLSTPVSYISEAKPWDPFGANDADSPTEGRYFYFDLQKRDLIARTLTELAFPGDEQMQERISSRGFMLVGSGPDRVLEIEISGSDATGLMLYLQGSTTGLTLYDPTNGTVSRGDIHLTGKGDLTVND